MKRISAAWAMAAGVAIGTAVSARAAGDGGDAVVFVDHGRTERMVEANAREDLRGRTQIEHQMDLDTGRVVYGLRYYAYAGKEPSDLVYGEGYIGMPEPAKCNWYYGGFLDLQIDGRSIGNAPMRGMSGVGGDAWGRIDMVFETTQAMVRVRFAARTGDDALLAQVRLEPKQKIASLRLILRCYPSAFSQETRRYVMTPVRELEQGKTVTLDGDREPWVFCADKLLDAGIHVAPHTGAGGCAALWATGQTVRASVGVGIYSIETRLDLDPAQRDFRFALFDFKGRKNAEAEASLRRRAADLQRELAADPFLDPRLGGWNPAARRAALARMTAGLPDAAAELKRFEAIAARMEALLKQRAAQGLDILAEAEAAALTDEWTSALPALRLRSLLNGI
jgi:hypothetical protein